MQRNYTTLNIFCNTAFASFFFTISACAFLNSSIRFSSSSASSKLELSEELGITPRHLQAIENENKTPSYNLLSRMLSYLNIPADSIINSTASELTPEQEQLLYLICYKCNQRDIAVLLSTAEALVNTKE